MEIIIFEKCSSSFKKPKHLKNNIFIIYSLRAVKIEPGTSMKIDTTIVVFLQGGKLNEICGPK